MKDYMVEAAWKSFDPKLYAANWHELFSTTDDDRKKLTWKDQFSEVLAYAYNFYSPGEQVLEGPNENESVLSAALQILSDNQFAAHTWVMQEIGKGCKNIFGYITFATCSGGWNFNTNSDDLRYIGYETTNESGSSTIYENYTNAVDIATALNNGEITDDELARYGFFKRFQHFDENVSEPQDKGEAAYRYIYETPRSEKVTLAERKHLDDLLSSSIPAMSFATGSNAINTLKDPLTGTNGKNFDMQTKENRGTTAWPQVRFEGLGVPYDDSWLHSDIRDVALPYVDGIFDKIIEIGGFRP